MNDYTVVKNALVAIALVLILMVAIQPGKMSEAVLGTHAMAKDALQSVVANTNGPAELQAASNEHIRFTVSTVDFSLPNTYSVTTEVGSSQISKETAEYNVSVHEFEGVLSDTALSLAEGGMQVRPVMHGSNLFYEICKDDALVVGLQDVGDGKYVKVIPEDTYERTVLHDFLSDLEVL